jgi:betaine-aldehyde dehydrogenase
VTDGKLFIDGAWVDAHSGDTDVVINATTEEPMGEFALADADDADRAVAAAQRAFDGWSRTPLTERVQVISRALDILSAREEEIALTVTDEVGTPLKSSRAIQAKLALDDIRNTLSAVDHIEWEQTIGNSLVVREPVGVVGAITPWNYPLHQAAAKVAPALVAGCTVVLKPAALAPLTSFVLADALHQAGLPAGAFNLLTGRGATVGRILAGHPGIDMISLTGSVGAGIDVMRTAAEGIRKVTLELGGKSAAIVLDDAPFDQAVARTVGSCFNNNGQMCSAVTRLLVPRSRLAEVTELAVASAESFTIGDPRQVSTRLGPVISAAQRESIQEYVRIGIAEGATLASGGPNSPAGLDRGYFVTPTVLSDVTPEMRVAQEEIFGPVLVIIPFADEDDAIAIANGTDFGLSGAVWSADPERAESVARRMRTGQVAINGGAFNSAAPFGGYKRSGIGRELGAFGLEDFLETKAMHR